MRIAKSLAVACLMALTVAVTVSVALPVLDTSSGIDNATIEELRASLNDTPKNLYVVRAVVYEIGILTEVGENDTDSFESQERVDLTFFDAHSNKSHIDLGNIPLPIQTNVSGQVLTGIAPVNLGAFSSAADLLDTLPLTGTIVNITHSDTAFYQLSHHNVSSAEGQQVLSEEELSHLTSVGSLFPSLGGILDAATAASDELKTVDNSNSDESELDD